MREDATDPVVPAKLERLHSLLHAHGSACIGYSGGVDSTFLAVTALRTLGADRMLAVTGLSAAVPEVQRAMARRCAHEFGIPHLEIETDELADPDYAANPSNRCYFCKTELWTRLTAIARTRGLAVVMDGANADDAHDYRPGARAAREHEVRSPLLETGLTKAEIRTLSRALDLPTWDQPAAPCLSSRVQYGIAINPQRLRQVEEAESRLRGLGFREFRVRHHGNAARVEVRPDERVRALLLAQPIAAALRSLGFDHALLDVEGYRRGALNEALPLVTLEPTR
jgi:uncharacterized protein